MFEVAAWTGLRLGELIGLRWGDVEIMRTPAMLSVWRSSYKRVDRPPKSRAGQREVLLIDRVIVTDAEVEIRYVLPTNPESEHVRFCHLRKDYFNHPAPG